MKYSMSIAGSQACLRSRPPLHTTHHESRAQVHTHIRDLRNWKLSKNGNLNSFELKSRQTWCLWVRAVKGEVIPGRARGLLTCSGDQVTPASGQSYQSDHWPTASRWWRCCTQCQQQSKSRVNIRRNVFQKFPIFHFFICLIQDDCCKFGQIP